MRTLEPELQRRMGLGRAHLHQRGERTPAYDSEPRLLRLAYDLPVSEKLAQRANSRYNAPQLTYLGGFLPPVSSRVVRLAAVRYG